MLIEPNPVITPEFDPIDKAIRIERTRLQDIEFETGKTPNDSHLRYLLAEKRRGIKNLIINL